MCNSNNNIPRYNSFAWDIEPEAFSFGCGFVLGFFSACFRFFFFFPVQGLQGSCAFLARYAGKIAFLKLPMQPSAGIERVDHAECW